ncbi:MAG: hypothetical protein MR378_00465, partial [Ruminococcus sp.]|nr:hypothetical protein [Ruminococcus sp.]
FLLVLAAPSSSLISASVICLSISLLYHIFARLAIVRCCHEYHATEYSYFVLTNPATAGDKITIQTIKIS